MYLGFRISRTLELRFNDLIEDTYEVKVKERIRWKMSKQDGYRIVELPDEFRNEVKKYYNHCGKPDLDRRLFLPIRIRVKDKPLDYQTARVNLQRIIRESGYTGKNIGLHIFRKTYAHAFYETALKQGRDALTLTSYLLRHSSVGMTMRYLGLKEDMAALTMHADIFNTYKSLSEARQLGQVDLADMLTEIRANRPQGPVEIWKTDLIDNLSEEYDRNEVEGTVGENFSLLIKATN